MPPRAAQYPEQQVHSRIPMSVPDWRQPQGLRGMPGFKPTCRAEFAAWTASGRACLGAGGRRQGQGGLSGRAKLRPVGGCCGACRAGRGTGGPRQGLAGLRDDAPSERSATKRRRCGGRRRACGAWPRCRWAAAGPGRASRRRAKRTISNQAPAVWRQPRGLRGLAAVPVGGGRARADYPAALSSARLEAAAGPAGPGRASRRRAERSSRRGRRAGGQAPRRPEIRRCHKPRPKVRTPRSTPGSGRPGGRRGARAR